MSLFTACGSNGSSGGCAGCGGSGETTTAETTTAETTTEEETTEKQEEEDDYAFEGVLVDSDAENGFITITSDAITVTFATDDETNVPDSLTHGDEVSISYEGYLSETPIAKNIEVISENQEVENHYVYGTVAYNDEGYLLVKYFSNDGATFKINDSTVIEGEDTTAAVGDEVMVVFDGEIADEETAATLVYVLYKAESEDTQVVAGKITKIEGTTFVLKTDNASYTFETDENTVYTGDKYAKNVYATVAYSGDLKSNPLATKIYCKKIKKKSEKESTTTKKEETTTKKETTTTKKETTTEKKTTKETTTEKKTTKETTTKKKTTKETTTKETTTKAKKVSDKGTITAFSSGASITVDTKKNGTVTLAINGKTTIPLGYYPRVNDSVKLTYDGSSNTLLTLTLVKRPSYNLKGTILSVGDYYEIQLDDSSVTKLNKEFPDVEVGKDNTISIQPSDDMTIAAGYSPQEGDVVKFVVDKNEDGGDKNVKITTLILVSRSEDQPIDPSSDDDDSDSDN